MLDGTINNFPHGDENVPTNPFGSSVSRSHINTIIQTATDAVGDKLDSHTEDLYHEIDTIQWQLSQLTLDKRSSATIRNHTIKIIGACSGHEKLKSFFEALIKTGIITKDDAKDVTYSEDHQALMLFIEKINIPQQCKTIRG